MIFTKFHERYRFIEESLEGVSDEFYRQGIGTKINRGRFFTGNAPYIHIVSLQAIHPCNLQTPAH